MTPAVHGMNANIRRLGRCACANRCVTKPTLPAPGILRPPSSIPEEPGIAHQGRTVSIQMPAPEWGVSLRPLDRPRPHLQRLCKMQRCGLALHLDSQPIAQGINLHFARGQLQRPAVVIDFAAV